jgi:uncharacterized protein
MSIVWQEAQALLLYVASSAWGLLPVFLLSVALSVLLKELRLDRLIHRAFTRKVGPAIATATAVGAFAPFCSCTVIPLINSMLVAGVPLAAVMSFWISSPTMDLEIFAVSVKILGWQLAIVRLIATITLSVGAGYITYILTRTHLLNEQGIMRAKVATTSCCSQEPDAVQTVPQAEPVLVPYSAARAPRRQLAVFNSMETTGAPVATLATISSCCGDTTLMEFAPATQSACCGSTANEIVVQDAVGCGCSVELAPALSEVEETSGSCGCSSVELVSIPSVVEETSGSCGCSSVELVSASPANLSEPWWAAVAKSVKAMRWQSFGQEVLRQFWLLGRWMLLAFFIEAALLRYVPSEVITHIFGGHSPFAIPLAALLGIPVYVNYASSWPIVSGLLAQGMRPGAAIAFLLAGPLTTLPAMMAVWNLVRPRVFFLYFGIALVGAIIIGYLVSIIMP